MPRQRLRDPVERVERLALDVYLQLPWYALPAQMDDLPSQTFTVPIHRRVHDAIRAAGGASAYARHYEQLVADGREHDRAVEESARWYLDAVAEAGDDAVARAVGQLAVEDLPETRPDRMEHYVWGIAVSLIRQGITRQIGDLHSELQRTASSSHASWSWRLSAGPARSRSSDRRADWADRRPNPQAPKTVRRAETVRRSSPRAQEGRPPPSSPAAARPLPEPSPAAAPTSTASPAPAASAGSEAWAASAPVSPRIGASAEFWRRRA